VQIYKNKMNLDSLYIYPAIFSSMTGKMTHLLIAVACLFHAGVSAQTLAEKPPMGWLGIHYCRLFVVFWQTFRRYKDPVPAAIKGRLVPTLAGHGRVGQVFAAAR